MSFVFFFLKKKKTENDGGGKADCRAFLLISCRLLVRKSFLSLKMRNLLIWKSKGGAAEQEEEANHKT